MTMKDIWKNSPYSDLVKLQSNNTGNVGEELINDIGADCNGSKTKKIGGSDGDGTIMNIPVEIKTAHQGCSYPSFQHELGEVPWNGSKYIIFVDISPQCIYLMKKHTRVKKSCRVFQQKLLLGEKKCF